MNDVTQILSRIEAGDPIAAEQLLPLVYDELRRLAAQRLAQEKQGQTLQATSLVHEAYLRLVDGAEDNALAAEDAVAAEIVKLRYFAGFSLEEAAGLLHLSRATAYRLWTYARA